ncbi:MAG: VWA domain-containing protein [Myxococcales bacterium]|nr:VWA domain-containing protein [Myxococcales bacterium]
MIQLRVGRGGSSWRKLSCALAALAVIACSADEGSIERSGRQDGDEAVTGGAGFGNAPSVTGDAPGGDFGNPTAGNGTPGAAGTDLPAPEDVLCAEGMAQANPVTPTVWLVIDSSGSMDRDFGGPTRWDALRTALVEPGGIVETLQSGVRFGMVIYNGPDNGQAQCMGTPDLLCGCILGFEPICCEPACGGTPPPPPDPASCANLVTIDPALDNYAAIDAAYPARQIGGWTPTDRAVDHVVTNLPVFNEQVLDTDTDPIYVILATDGAPNDNCGMQLNGQGASNFQPEVAARVLDTVNQGVSMGMKMFVISLAGDDQQLRQHLDEVALMGNTGSPAFEPTNPDDLVQTLQEILGGTTCQVELNGAVEMGRECTGEVTINGFPVECGSPDGWSMADERTVQLNGQACTDFLGAASQVIARFPCGVFVPD